MKRATAEPTGTRVFALCALLALAAPLLGCDVYESDLVRGSRREGQAADDAGMEGVDAGESECELRAGDVRCPRRCAERCNGRDDDCDGVVDEAAASERCTLAHADAVCRAGTCLITRCREGYRDCDQQADNGCEVVSWDPAHCMGCGRGCSLPRASATCVSGACEVAECLEGYADCDADRASCETRLDSDTDCGACGRSCAQLPHTRASCVDGRCQLRACDEGYADCDHDSSSCESDLQHDPAHCGSCAGACRFGVESPHARAGCEDGACVARCEDGYGDCDGAAQNGCEVPLRGDENCGACGRACSATHAQTRCAEGRGMLGACEPGWGDCNAEPADGCEQSLSSPAACGSCGRRCELPHAVARCNTSPLRCELERCEDGYQDCDGNADNGCERDARPAAMGGQGPCLPDASCAVASQGGHNFYFCSAPRSWDQARALCRAQLNGDLARLRDAATRDFIKARLRERAWIGHSDRARADLWIWVSNGVPFWQGRANGKPLNGAFASWSSNEPNGTGDCGALAASGGMEDLACADAQPFVCEVSMDLCPDDPGKSDPGQCGCGRPDTDANGDGLADCAP